MDLNKAHEKAGLPDARISNSDEFKSAFVIRDAFFNLQNGKKQKPAADAA